MLGTFLKMCVWLAALSTDAVFDYNSAELYLQNWNLWFSSTSVSET